MATARLHSEPRFLHAGDRALTVELGNVIDPAVNDLVVTLDDRIRAAAIPGVEETIPTYRSLQVVYDPLVIRAARLIPLLRALVPERAEPPRDRRRWRVPVCYGGEHGMDLDFVAETHAITTDEVIALHSSAEYRVYMIGFAPGFAYLGGLPEPLHTPRRQNPRTLTPASSISIGGIQAAVSSMPVPSGWHMLGRTPVRTFDSRRKAPFLMKTGDLVRFFAIDAPTFDRLDALADRGETVADSESVA